MSCWVFVLCLVLGLDDIRVVQPHSPTNDIDPTVIYLTQYAMDSVASKFPYLVWKKLREGQEVRQVAQLDWRIIEDDYDKPFVASGLKFVPLPVMHGEDYICLGFLFGEKSKVAYISDVPRFPSNTEYVISKSGSGQLDLLIMDCLYKVCYSLASFFFTVVEYFSSSFFVSELSRIRKIQKDNLNPC
ncbi:uncharacterized protein [Gossypium hirsutum]|uniref:Uncharacterized protein isoform X3 n=1 Tax=Gossypium hirsutum TaxID=3635 RepID=A0ABM3AZJ9_GOSHI|nr:uncharacterized protein LOC107920980 isoform X3 [Gossypium hirsutum]